MHFWSRGFLAIVLAICCITPFVIGGNLYFSPSGASTWDGGCANVSSCTAAAPCSFGQGTTAITTFDEPSCAIYLVAGSYGSSSITISATSAPLELYGLGDGVVNIGLEIATDSWLSVHNLQLKTLYSSFTATGDLTNHTEMLIENSIFTVEVGSDPTSSTIEIVRSNSVYLPTTIRNSTFTTSSSDLQSVIRAGTLNLTLQDVTLQGDSRAIIGNCRSLVLDHVTSNTPNIFQGDAEEVQILDSSITGISRYAFVGTTAMTSFVAQRSNFTGAARFLDPDQLLSDPQLNTLSTISLSNVVSGSSFTFGALVATGQVSISTSSFAEVFGTLDLSGATSVSVTGNSFNRSYDATLLGLFVHQDTPTIQISGNTFSQKPSKTNWNTAMVALSNVTSLSSNCDVSINSLAIGETVELDGAWTILDAIKTLGGTHDLINGSSASLSLTLGSISITNVSIALSTDSLTYQVTNSSKGIVGPNTTLGYSIQLSSLPRVTWNEKVLNSLPTLSQAYPFFTSLSALPSEAYRVDSRFNYSMAAGTHAYEAKLVFNPVPCPSNCNPAQSSSQCLVISRCLCTGSFGGPSCYCNQTGIPSSAECSETGNPVWEFDSSATISNLIVPSGHDVQVTGDLIATGSVVLPAGSSLNASGAIQVSGNFQFSGVVSANENGACQLFTPNQVKADSLVFSGSPNVKVTLDISGLPTNFTCTSTSGSTNATFYASTTTTMSPTTSWTVLFNDPTGNAKRSLERDSLDVTEFRITAALLRSGNPAGSSSSTTQTSATAPSGSCSSFTSSAGALDVSVHPCAPVAPTPDSTSGPTSKNRDIKWWYWGIPVIVVGAVLIIVFIALLIARPCCKKTKPYRGSI